MSLTERVFPNTTLSQSPAGSQNKMTLAWIPRHNTHQGNEKADKLAREGASTASTEPKPYYRVAMSITRKSIKLWIEE